MTRRDPSTHSEREMSAKDRREWSLATGRDIRSVKDLDRYQKETGKAIVDKGFVPKPPEDITDDEVGKMIEQHRKERFGATLSGGGRLRPLEDNVVIQPIVEKISDTIIVPDGAKEKPTRGRVVAVGPGRWLAEAGRYEPVDIKIGDEVVYQQYSGSEIDVDGETFWMIRSSDVLAQVEA